MTVLGRNGVIKMTPPYLRRRATNPEHKADLKGKRLIGEVIGHKAGYGFVIINNRKRLFLPQEEMNRVLDGDLIKVAMIYDPSQTRECAKVIEILARKQKTILGYYHEDNGKAYLIPCNPRIPRAIYIHKPIEHISDNNVMEVKLLSHRRLELSDELEGKPVGSFHKGGEVQLETDIAINAYRLESAFPPEALKEAQSLPTTVDPADHPNRRQLTDLPFMTMDGEDARDYDDAVFCYKEGDLFHLKVAVADVAYYVRPETLLDKNARMRTASAYFPNRVLPMLPEKLSNDLCSLNPECNRLAMICDLVIDGTGKRQKVSFYEAVIRSQARLTYEEVALLMEGERERKKLPVEVHASLRVLKEVTNVLLKARQERCALDFVHLEEVRVNINDKGEMQDFYTYRRNFAHRMIEEAMLAANDATAWFLSKKGVPFLYRIHKAPEKEALDELKLFLGNYRIKVPEGHRGKVDSAVYDYLLKAINKYPEAAVLETRILRSLQRAEYSRKNYGHFGLNYKSYTHFTSPIRRYADLMVHRAIKKVIRKEGSGRREYPYSAAEVSMIGARCSQQERNIEQSVWQILDALKCRYMKQHKESIHQGTITTVLEFGFYVRLKDIPVEGLVHVRSFDDDYYKFDSIGQRLRGTRGKKEYKLGGSLSVKVKNINVEERKIDFVVVR